MPVGPNEECTTMKSSKKKEKEHQAGEAVVQDLELAEEHAHGNGRTPEDDWLDKKFYEKELIRLQFETQFPITKGA